MSSLPADRAIEARFIWTSRKTARPVRSYADLQEWLRQVERAYRARLMGDGVHDIMQALAGFVGPEGCHPSQETLAKAAGRNVRTAKRAVQRNPLLGLLRVRHRPRFIIRTGSKVRLGRQTNDYTLLIPRDLPTLAHPSSSSMLKKERDSLRSVSGDNLSPSAPRSVEAQRAALPTASGNLLEARRHVIADRMRAERAARERRLGY